MNLTPAIVLLDGNTGAPELVSSVLEAFSVGSAFVGVYDESDFLLYANHGFLKAFDLKAGQVATFSSIILDAVRFGKTLHIEAEDPLAFIADAQMRRRILAQPPRQRSFPVDFVDDQWYWCTETLLPNGWIVLTGADITPLKQTEKTLSAERDRALLLSEVDELTGVPNRRFVLGKLDQFLSAARTVCVALLDLDHFKSINDSFGHEAGDAALHHFAQHCVASLPSPNMLGRLGGEEFLILFPDATCDEIKAALERILATIPPLPARLLTRTLSFSAGVARGDNGESRNELLARADKALYFAKQSGRSRVEIYQSSIAAMQDSQ